MATKMLFNELAGSLEAVLFASGEPLTIGQLSLILGVDAQAVEELIIALARSLKERASGLMIREVAGGWQLVTRPEHFQYIEKFVQTVDRRLTPPALETLAIIAFKQPVTKQEIEDIRGVHAERMIAQLIERDLVTEVGRKEALGRPILYGTTNAFLRALGLSKLDELPNLPEPEPGSAPAENETDEV